MITPLNKLRYLMEMDLLTFTYYKHTFIVIFLPSIIMGYHGNRLA